MDHILSPSMKHYASIPIYTLLGNINLALGKIHATASYLHEQKPTWMIFSKYDIQQSINMGPYPINFKELLMDEVSEKKRLRYWENPAMADMRALNFGLAYTQATGTFGFHLLTELNNIIEPFNPGLLPPESIVQKHKTEPVMTAMARFDDIMKASPFQHPMLAIIWMHLYVAMVAPFDRKYERTLAVFIQLYITYTQKWPLPLCPYTRYLRLHQERYQTLLKEALTSPEALESFAIFILEAIFDTLQWTHKLMTIMDQSLTHALNTFQQKGMHVDKWIKHFYHYPITKFSMLIHDLDVVQSTALRVAQSFVTIGMIASPKVGREYVYQNTTLFKMIDPYFPD
jgi:hypothetical protein